MVPLHLSEEILKKLHALLLAAVVSCTVSAAPIRTLSGFTGVTFYELTSGVTSFTYGPNDSAITTRLAGGLTVGNNDFTGAPAEFYDVFYSDSNGAPNIDGELISIEAYYNGNGAGLNIGEVQLNFGVNPIQYVTSVASYVSASGFLAGNLNYIIDGNINTATGMGSNDEGRMRVTVGFEPAAPPTGVPEPSTWMLGLAGLAGVFAMRRRQ